MRGGQGTGSVVPGAGGCGEVLVDGALQGGFCLVVQNLLGVLYGFVRVAECAAGLGSRVRLMVGNGLPVRLGGVLVLDDLPDDSVVRYRALVVLRCVPVPDGAGGPIFFPVGSVATAAYSTVTLRNRGLSESGTADELGRITGPRLDQAFNRLEVRATHSALVHESEYRVLPLVVTEFVDDVLARQFGLGGAVESVVEPCIEDVVLPFDPLGDGEFVTGHGAHLLLDQLIDPVGDTLLRVGLVPPPRQPHPLAVHDDRPTVLVDPDVVTTQIPVVEATDQLIDPGRPHIDHLPVPHHQFELRVRHDLAGQVLQHVFGAVELPILQKLDLRRVVRIDVAHRTVDNTLLEELLLRELRRPGMALGVLQQPGTEQLRIRHVQRFLGQLRHHIHPRLQLQVRMHPLVTGLGPLAPVGHHLGISRHRLDLVQGGGVTPAFEVVVVAFGPPSGHCLVGVLAQQRIVLGDPRSRHPVEPLDHLGGRVGRPEAPGALGLAEMRGRQRILRQRRGRLDPIVDLPANRDLFGGHLLGITGRQDRFLVAQGVDFIGDVLTRRERLEPIIQTMPGSSVVENLRHLVQVGPLQIETVTQRLDLFFRHALFFEAAQHPRLLVQDPVLHVVHRGDHDVPRTLSQLGQIPLADDPVHLHIQATDA
ncbi:hypothetical protein ACFWF7_14705 [Nocardia sp. NPDC060256]|uniref:hypothetical protein n=1 Tax=Nocardia sp. NPDC060256 TaxID=3347086 RepID=UPI003647CBB2